MLKDTIIIAGPCSAESRQQVLQTAEKIRTIYDINSLEVIFRAGLWKPRTHPDSFCGVGTEGISWLKEVQDLYHIPVATEVATAEHLMLCVQNSILHLWIGARTVSNPFAVQQLADALSSLDEATKQEIVIYIKNPISADIELWSGAVERILGAGIQHVRLVHRGFTSANETEYRNAPLWAVPIEMHRRYPQLKLLSDPSHISGNSRLVGKIAQQALNLYFDGLMIETHCNPKDALSDAQQQLTPDELLHLLSALYRPSGEHEDNRIIQLREQINDIDNQIWQLIANRMHVAKQIGEVKNELSMPILQLHRFDDILSRRLDWAKEHGISEDTIRQITTAIHAEAIKQQL